MKISVVIVTYNRLSQCRSCLDSLALSDQISIELEIFIGVNGRDSKTSVMLSDFRKNNPSLCVKVLEFPESKNPSEIRNEICKSANGDWVFFVDDDAYIGKNFFAQFNCTKNNFPEAVVVGGPNLSPSESKLFQKASGVALSSRFGTYFSAKRYRSLGPAKKCGEEALILCNLFVKKSVLQKAPFLKTLFCCEENYFLQNLTADGFDFVYDPQLEVRHERRSNIRAFTIQIFRYGFGRGRLFKLNRRNFRLEYFIPTSLLIYGLLLFFLIVSKNTEHHSWHFLPMWLYVGLCIFTSLKKIFFDKNSLAATALSAFLFPILHLSYGAGLLCGILEP